MSSMKLKDLNVRVINKNLVSLIPYKGINPKLAENVFLADGVRLIGDVEIGEDSSVWFNVVIRADVNHVRIGPKTNIQDSSCLHVEHETHPLIIEEGVTVGHSVTLHGCHLKPYSLIGMGATVLNGAIIGEESLIGAGALIPEGAVIPPRSLVVGVPGKVRRELSREEVDSLHESARHYIDYANSYFL